MLKEEYKGWEITYDEQEENFRAEKDNNVVEDSKLKVLKRKIDNFNVVREKVFFDKYGKITEGEVTSKVGDSQYRVAYMEKDYSGSNYKTWTKLSRGKIFKHNKNNQKIFEEVSKKHEQIDKLNKEISDLQSKLTPFETPPKPANNKIL